MQDSWVITFERRPWSLNAERTWHFHKRADQVSLWMSFFRDKALELHIPHLDKISVEVFCTSGTRALQDAGNALPAAKAAVDGLVHAGVINDDGPKYVTYLRLWAPTYEKGIDSLTLEISEA